VPHNQTQASFDASIGTAETRLSSPGRRLAILAKNFSVPTLSPSVVFPFYYLHTP
jgi:hypothetical protein